VDVFSYHNVQYTYTEEGRKKGRKEVCCNTQVKLALVSFVTKYTEQKLYLRSSLITPKRKFETGINLYC